VHVRGLWAIGQPVFCTVHLGLTVPGTVGRPLTTVPGTVQLEYCCSMLTLRGQSQ